MSELTRREFALMSGAAALAATTPVPTTAAPQAAPRVLDLHTHVFSVLYLPIEGIAARWCEDRHIDPAVGRAVAVILNTIAVSLSGTHFTAEELGGLGRRLLETSKEALLEELFDLTPQQAFDDARVRAALTELDAELKGALENVFIPKAAFRPGFFRLFEKFLAAIPRYFGLAVNYLRWVRLLVHNEHQIFATLRQLSPSVGYFVHHLMDMQHYYEGGPVYGVEKHQLPIMGKLNRENAGRLFGFVAWDPLRQGDLRIIQTALTNGFIGVKFYPPNGYMPLGNAGKIKDGDKIDKANLELFGFCERYGVPLFAHCTPEGFESRKDFGCFADPQNWVPVIARFKELRLCLGHAGGEEWWLDGPANDCKLPPFGKTATDLCLASEYVYCEIAYMNDLRSLAGRAAFVKHVKELLKRDDKIKSRLCYGTDWMMPEMFIQRTETYLAALREAFKDADLAPWADRFFFANAVDYLNLPKFVARHDQFNPSFLPASAKTAVQAMLR